MVLKTRRHCAAMKAAAAAKMQHMHEATVTHEKGHPFPLPLPELHTSVIRQRYCQCYTSVKCNQLKLVPIVATSSCWLLQRLQGRLPSAKSAQLVLDVNCPTRCQDIQLRHGSLPYSSNSGIMQLACTRPFANSGTLSDSQQYHSITVMRTTLQLHVSNMFDHITGTTYYDRIIDDFHELNRIDACPATLCTAPQHTFARSTCVIQQATWPAVLHMSHTLLNKLLQLMSTPLISEFGCTGWLNRAMFHSMEPVTRSAGDKIMGLSPGLVLDSKA